MSIQVTDKKFFWFSARDKTPLFNFALFYKRYLGDIYSHHKKNCTDHLYHEFNNYHPDIYLTIEINPKKFPDTEVITRNGKIETPVYRKSTKLPVP